jgi:putative oxidoreductase
MIEGNLNESSGFPGSTETIATVGSAFPRSMIQRLLDTRASAANALIRLMVGGVFLSEGIQKFLYPADLGSGRFEKIGLPAPEFFGPFVGSFETICGALILLGLGTRLAAIPLIFIMLVALFTVKIPILIGEEFLGFALRPLPRYGVLSMLHESRNDFCMLLGSVFLLITGAGPWSIDSKLVKK